MRVLVVSKSLCGYVSNQGQYNIESAHTQYFIHLLALQFITHIFNPLTIIYTFIILFYFIAYIPPMRSIVYNSYAISHLVIIIIPHPPYILHQHIYDTI